VKRDDATRRIGQLLERVINGGDRYLDAVDEVSVFGSYAAGALAPNDVDLAVHYTDPTGKIGEELVQRMFAGRNMMTPFEQALRDRQRGLNIVFNVREQLERQGGFDFVTLWQRGDSLEVALERLQAIKSDPQAGSAPREHVHPMIVGHEKRTLIDARKQLIELDRKGAVKLRRLEIAREREPQDERLRRVAGWGYSEQSPRRRAMRALLAHLEAEGVPVEDSDRGVIFAHDLPDGPFATVHHGAERLGYALDDARHRSAKRSYCVLNLNGHGAFSILEIEAIQIGPDDRNSDE
jgi:hypothetical protein